MNRLLFVFAVLLSLIALAGCVDDVESPVGPDLAPLAAIYSGADITLNGDAYSALYPSPCPPDGYCTPGWRFDDDVIYTFWDSYAGEEGEWPRLWVEYEAELSAGNWRVGLNAINYAIEGEPYLGLGDDPEWYPQFKVATDLTSEIIIIPASDTEVNHGFTYFNAPSDAWYTVRFAWLNDKSQCLSEGCSSPEIDANIQINSVFFDKVSGNPVVQSVTGSGSFTVEQQQGDWRTFSFTARRHADGTVKGQWDRIRRQAGNAAHSKSHGVVTCFTIMGDEAWLDGYATTGLWSDPPNNEVRWRVKDNGQGKKADPDQISLQGVGWDPGSAVDYCANTPRGVLLNDIEAGNIQVKQ